MLIKLGNVVSYNYPLSLLFESYLNATLRNATIPEPTKTTINNKIGALSLVFGFSTGTVLVVSPVVSLPPLDPLPLLSVPFRGTLSSAFFVTFAPSLPSLPSFPLCPSLPSLPSFPPCPSVPSLPGTGVVVSSSSTSVRSEERRVG